MADTAKSEEVVDTVPNGETKATDPAPTPNGDAQKSVEVKEDATTKDGEKSNDTIEEKKDEASEQGHANEENGSASPDHKRKGTNDHYRGDNKRSRGGGRGGRGGARGGRGGRGGSYNGNMKGNNIKRSFDDQPESDDPVEIRRQVEFYFSDSNLPVDSYLLNMVEGSKNQPVDLKTIHNFKRMRHFQPFSAVVAAVKESKVLDVEDRDNTAYVTRKQALHDKFTADVVENRKLLTSDTMNRSIYAKGFGEEGRTTHLDIEEFFAPYGPINSIRLRRSDHGDFKGSVFVEFADVDIQQRFLDLDPKPTFGGDDRELQIMSKQAYVDKKHQDILDGNVRPRSPSRNYRGHSGTFKRGGGRGGHDRSRRYSDRRDRSRSPGADDWKARRERDQRNGNRDDRKRSQRGGRGRGGRGKDRDDRRRRRYSDESEEERSRSRSRSRTPFRNQREADEDAGVLSRAEAEAEKAKSTDDSKVDDAEAGAEKGQSKKRAREEEEGAVEGESEQKKVKEVEAEA